MQTLSQIRQALLQAHLAPRKQFGQCFLIDLNLMVKLVDLAGVNASQKVLEVGPGTGSLTEELLARAGHVVAIEIDRGLQELLRHSLGERENLTLLCGDVLEGKHALSAAVTDALAPAACLVSNLPYQVATPLVAQCLSDSWRSRRGQPTGSGRPTKTCRFDRLTFTVQQEVADRMRAEPGSKDFGPVSVTVSLLGQMTLGPTVPASAFWPQPKVASRMVRIDFNPVAADRLADVDVLHDVLRLAFAQRRKQIGSLVRRRGTAYSREALAGGLEAAGIDPACRAENVRPGQFLALANHLARPENR